MKKLLYILYAAIGLVGLFVLTNVGINIYERSARVVTLCVLGIYPFYLPLDGGISSGCFAVDVYMMKLLGELVDNEKKPILLYAY